MTSKMKRMTCRALVVSLLALSFQTANAGMIGAETAAQLQAQGIDPADARARVATMTDQEVQQLTQDMHTAPAGAITSGGWLAIIIIAGLVWYFAYRK